MNSMYSLQASWRVPLEDAEATCTVGRPRSLAEDQDGTNHSMGLGPTMYKSTQSRSKSHIGDATRDLDLARHIDASVVLASSQRNTSSSARSPCYAMPQGIQPLTQ
jgi:hypothetical protein